MRFKFVFTKSLRGRADLLRLSPILPNILISDWGLNIAIKREGSFVVSCFEVVLCNSDSLSEIFSSKKDLEVVAIFKNVLGKRKVENNKGSNLGIAFVLNNTLKTT